MDAYANLLIWVVVLGCIVILFMFKHRKRFYTVKMKIRRALPAPWTLYEFLHLKPSRWGLGQYYSFSEETVRSLGYRFIGRFDRAIFHWEDTPVLDLIIEHKFPTKYLPENKRPEDMFQTGLYALALYESGVSCSTTLLINVYCLQDQAIRCMEGNSMKDCWSCGGGKIHISQFDPNKVIKSLEKIDEIWYRGRKPKPSPEKEKCRACPYSRDRCNYSAF
ncbi:MAG: hypothetical protein ACFFE6_04510 [Candidatus Thorarchaeota archaeon]